MTRSHVITLCFIVIGVCLFFMALLIYAQIMGVGQARRDLTPWQLRRLEKQEERRNEKLG